MENRDNEILDEEKIEKEEEKNEDKSEDRKIEKEEDKIEDNKIEKEEEKRAEEIRKRIESYKKAERASSFRIKPPFFFLTIFLLIISLYFTFGNNSSLFDSKKEVSYTQFIEKIRLGEIKEIKESDTSLEGIKKIDGKIEIYTTNKITNRIGQDEKLLSLIEANNVNVIVVGKSMSSYLLNGFVSLLPMLLIIFFFMYINKQIMGSQGGGMNPFNIGKTKSKMKEKPKVKFEDVASLVEEKEELREIVEFLKNPARFEKAGARVPKGILLLGEPGTGKTLLAKAVAGESGASFFSISGSEFVELYVGVGASRVRDLFNEAKKDKPSIIFIDEIDAVGRRRGQNKNGGNDEREQTLNQLLVEMDGFETDQRIIVIAATNRADVLDPALLRGGRFDRRITVSAPDVNGRIEILKVHSKNKKLASDVKLEDIAKITPGFVGADLENLLNEAAILAARRNSDTILMSDLDEAVDKIGMGLGQKNKIISKRDKLMLAYHEGGHALVASLLENANKVHKVTIIPRGDAGGYMMPLPEETLGKTKSQLLAEINVLFAGRAAEELMLDDIATGAYSDIKRATEIAKMLVTRVGMNTNMGPINYEQGDNEFNFVSEISNETIREIDLEVRKILKEKYSETIKLLEDNKEKLENIANLLIERETVTGSEIRALSSGITLDELKNMKKEELEEKYY